MRKRWIFIIPAAIAGMIVFTALGGGVVKMLWNWLLPPLFGWHQITFWQAIGLLALCRILFGGFGLHGPGAYRRRNGRWQPMTEEERERFRQNIRERCGFGPATGEDQVR